MKKYMLILAFLLATVSGCSSLGSLGLAAVSGAASGGIDTELVVGTKEEAINTHLEIGTSANRYEAQSIGVIEQIPPLFMLLLILGWLMPSPHEIWRGICNVFKGK